MSRLDPYVVKNRKSFNEVTWDSWIRANQATPIPGAIEFVSGIVDCSNGKTCVDKVFYVSNRECSSAISASSTSSTLEKRKLNCPQLKHTMDVMKEFPRSDDHSVYYLKGMYSNLRSKKEIREEIGKHNRIVMLVGDNLRDFVEKRQDYAKEEARLNSMWGTRWIILPNPAYGSWPDELVPDNASNKIESMCGGKRPSGPDKWKLTAAWDDCAYSTKFTAIQNSLDSWAGE